MHKDGFSRQDLELIRPVVIRCGILPNSTHSHHPLATCHFPATQSTRCLPSSGQCSICKLTTAIPNDWFVFSSVDDVREYPICDCFYFQKDSQLVFATVHANREEITEELCAAMQRLWQDEGVQECYRRSNEYQASGNWKGWEVGTDDALIF